MTPNSNFWHEMAALATSNSIIMDRPKESPHPRYPDVIYPLDYGYLEGTTSADGDGTDVCTEEDVQIIQDFHQQMHTLYIPNPMVATT